MNLSNVRFDQAEFDQLLFLIRTRKLSYQPFRFDDDHEVGEGMAFLAETSWGSKKGVVHWPNPTPDISQFMVAPVDLQQFRAGNDALRKIYDYFVSSLCRELGGDIAGLDFAEYGCNTGYFLYSLALRGARQTFGLDFTYNEEIFDLFNRKLGTNARFLFSEWDSLLHRPHYNAPPEVDACLSVAVLCHLSDPLHHLTYLCSRARKAVFVWTPSHQSDDLYISFGKPAQFNNSMAWPVGFDNLVKPSTGLLELCLRECGFEDIRRLKPIETPFDKLHFWRHHVGYVALRTRDAATIYTGGNVRRDLPTEVPASAISLEGSRP